MYLRRAPLVFALLLPIVTFTACKPPATDEAAQGRMFGDGPDAPPPPLESPDSEGAFWTNSKEKDRIIYGQGGKAPLMAMRCLGQGADAALQITRLSPADEGAQAMFAMVGNSHVLRMPVNATQVPGGFVWQGTVAADNPDLEALTGPSGIFATLPGAGMVTLNPSQRLQQVVTDCRARAVPRPNLDIVEPQITDFDGQLDTSSDADGNPIPYADERDVTETSQNAQ